MAFTSYRTPEFREQLRALPVDVQRAARDAYRMFKANPRAPGLAFKIVSPKHRIWSARVGIDYRACATVDGDIVIWFFIGDHRRYDALTKGFNRR